MLIMYVMDKPSKCEDYLHSIEFSYNNGYQTSLKMHSIEALYGRKCNTPVSWDNPTKRVVLGPEFLREMEEKIVKNKQNLKATQDMEKSDADKGRIPREFKFGEHMFLKVKPKKSSLNLGATLNWHPDVVAHLKSWIGCDLLHTCLHFFLP
jgi:hypothetical protein